MPSELFPEELPLDIPRTVKPHKRQYARLPVVALDNHTYLTEQGETGPIEDLIANLSERPRTLFTKVASADWVASLDTQFTGTPGWQWRASVHERDICRPDGVRVASRVSTCIHFFGWKGRAYHKIIEPVTMYGRRLDEIIPGDEPQIIRLLQWAILVRDFCNDNSIEVRPTTGSISGQFLTDPRFYPRARRKVPSATNQRSRENLPGNYYILNVTPKPGREYIAHYLDQHRAHHYHAATTSLPHSDHLYAYGRFADLAHIVFPDVWENFYGLYCLDLESAPAGRRAFHWLGRDTERVFMFSNELPHLLDMGFRVKGVRAAWGSRFRDTGLSKYSRWAQEQLDTYDDPAWLKPLLLSAYGILATRPRIAEAVFKEANRGEPVTLRTGKHELSGKLVKATRKLEPRIANVLHRGMIEAATRSETVGLAQYLNSLGHRVLSIYADAVIVEHDDDRPLPTLPEPWRTKNTLNHLQFINQQAFTSGEMTKLPGVGRDLLPFKQAQPGKAPRRRRLVEAGTGSELYVNAFKRR